MDNRLRNAVRLGGPDHAPEGRGRGGTLGQPPRSQAANIDAPATRYWKPIVIAESQYPWTVANGDSTGNFVWQSSQVSDGYPATPGGQLSFYNDMLSILVEVPHGLGQGLFYCEPEWIRGVGASLRGARWGDLCDELVTGAG